MALKSKVTKDVYEKFSKDIKAEYIEKDGEYFLDVEGGIKDEEALLRAKDHEKKARQQAEKELKELKVQLEEITNERDGMLSGSIPKADAEKLQKSAADKLAKREKELGEQIAMREQQLTGLLVDNVATGLAAKISTAPGVLLPHIQKRLKAEQVDGKLVTRVLNVDGSVSAATVEDLEKEFLANKDFAPILTANRASGGGANGANKGGGASGQKTIDRATFDGMSHVERATFSKTGGTVTE